MFCLTPQSPILVPAPEIQYQSGSNSDKDEQHEPKCVMKLWLLTAAADEGLAVPLVSFWAALNLIPSARNEDMNKEEYKYVS